MERGSSSGAHQVGSKQIVEGSETASECVFDMFLQVPIVTSIVNSSVETLPDLSGSVRGALATVETIIVAVFTIEYLLRITVAGNRIGFVPSTCGVVDLLRILP